MTVLPKSAWCYSLRIQQMHLNPAGCSAEAKAGTPT